MEPKIRAMEVSFFKPFMFFFVAMACCQQNFGKRGKVRLPLDMCHVEEQLLPHSAQKYLEAEIYAAKGMYRRAANLTESALSTDPSNPYLMVSLAGFLHRQGKDKKAKKILSDIISCSPDYEYALCLYGDIERDEGMLEKAEALYRKGIRAEPNSVFCYLRLIKLLRDSGKFDIAYSVVEELISKTPGFVDAYSIASELAFKIGKVDRANQYALEYARAVSLHQNKEGYSFILDMARKMNSSGYYSYARELFQVYLDVFPHDINCTREVVNLLMKAGKENEAIEIASRLKALPELKAQLLFLARDYDGAFRKVMKVEPTDCSDGRQSSPAKLIKAVGFAKRHEINATRQCLNSFNEGEAQWRDMALKTSVIFLMSAGFEQEALQLLVDYSKDGHILCDYGFMNNLSIVISKNEKLGSEIAEIARIGGAIQYKILTRWAGFFSNNDSDIKYLVNNIDSFISSASENCLSLFLSVKLTLVAEGFIEVSDSHLNEMMEKLEVEGAGDRVLETLKARFDYLHGRIDMAVKKFMGVDFTGSSDLIWMIWYLELLNQTGDFEEARALANLISGLNPPLYFIKRVVKIRGSIGGR